MNSFPFTFKEVKQKAKLQLSIKDYLFVSLLFILLPSINRSYITNSYEISILFYPIKFESWYLYFGLFVIIDLIKILLSYIEVNYVLDNINNKTNKSIFDYFKEVDWQNFWDYLAK